MTSGCISGCGLALFVLPFPVFAQTHVAHDRGEVVRSTDYKLLVCHRFLNRYSPTGIR